MTVRFAPPAPACFKALVPLLALGLAGCMLPPPQKPLAKSLTPESAGSAQSLAGTAEGAWPESQWWKIWQDPQLDALMDKALADAPDIRLAAARLAAAQAGLGEARAAGGIQAGLTGQAVMVRQSYNSGFPKPFVPKGYNDSGRIALELGYNVDLWGRNRAAVASARAEAEAARLDVAQSRLALSTALASAYAELQLRDTEMQLAQNLLGLRREASNLARVRVREGVANEAESAQAQAQEAATLADLESATQARDLVRTRIAALAGLGPDSALSMTDARAQALQSHGLPADLPLNLIGRRPDILAARARLEAAAERIKVARASYYPNININGFIGLQALGLDRLIAADSHVGQVGPAISLPIFGSKTIRARHRRAEADYEAARASYDAVLLQALRDVADARQSRARLDQQLQAQRRQCDSAQTLLRLARQRYDAGIAPYALVLESQMNLVAAQRELAHAETQSLLLDVALVRALGGGFRQDTP